MICKAETSKEQNMSTMKTETSFSKQISNLMMSSLLFEFVERSIMAPLNFSVYLAAI